jgi:hypothetical protein
MRERRAVLMSVRRPMTRVALRAEDVLAIDFSSVPERLWQPAFQVFEKQGRRNFAAGWAGL